MELYENNFVKKYANNVHSQNGEDGVIKELLSRLDIHSGWVCEFGAWDGKHLSNTFRLVELGFNAVYIEGDYNKYHDLLKTCEDYPLIIPINTFIDHNESENSLDNILKKTNIPEDFDILSIDIDSFDYQVWKSLKYYKPKLVIIEINSSVNTENSEWIHTPNLYQGTGFKPMFDLGIEKGYQFLFHTGNMFFLRNDLIHNFNIDYVNPLENFDNRWI